MYNAYMYNVYNITMDIAQLNAVSCANKKQQTVSVIYHVIPKYVPETNMPLKRGIYAICLNSLMCIDG